ncbi:MAG: hypothetical protein KC635_10890, partial [Myxococcales bacterium]|nr:hypothetical protein [Myxococcales bacterium]
LALLALAAGPARADAPTGRHAFPTTYDAEGNRLPRPEWDLSVRGYGQLLFAWYDYDLDQTRAGGAREASRLVFDTTRFTMEIEGALPFGLEFEAEVELEHHGAGAAVELEYDEFGEYEQEVEAGGEVVLEELFLAKSFGPLRLRLGRFYLGVGLLSELYRPTEYLAAARPESEQIVIPGVWDELGVEATLRLESVLLTLQVVNGLDSTGFSSATWISGGHQQRFELVSASDLAVVLRADWTPTPGLTVGASAYYGGTTRNRPKADLLPDCDDPGDTEVAPCGVVSADVLLVDGHVTVDLPPFTARAVALWGHLANAGAVSDRNARLSNNLAVPRTPIADEAFFAWLELGVDLAPTLGMDPGHHLEPFVRLEYYDTMFDVRDGVFDNPRFARAVSSVGVGWAYGDLVYAKLDWTHREVGAFEDGTDLRAEDGVRLGVGFTY